MSNEQEQDIEHGVDVDDLSKAEKDKLMDDIIQDIIVDHQAHQADCDSPEICVAEQLCQNMLKELTEPVEALGILSRLDSKINDAVDAAQMQSKIDEMFGGSMR